MSLAVPRLATPQSMEKRRRRFFYSEVRNKAKKSEDIMTLTTSKSMFEKYSEDVVDQRLDSIRTASS